MRTSGIALAVGLVCGFVVSVYAARNASGTYSLPSGNPVVTGTIITSTWANNTLNDLKTELTDSLSRSGKGPMLAALELVNGTVGTPALSFDSDTDVGLYRIGADNIGVATGGTKRLDISSTAVGVTGAATVSNGLTVTVSAATGDAIVGTGATNGNGVRGVSSDSVAGVYGTSSGGGAGVEGLGNSSGVGGNFTGGAAGGWGVTALGTLAREGVNAVGGVTNAAGGKFTGGGTGQGVIAHNGTDATAGTRQDAIKAANGDIDMLGVADPASTTSISDRITPVSFVKVWGKVTYGTADPSVAAGLNIASDSCGSSKVTLNVGGDFTTADYAVVVTSGSAGDLVYRVDSQAEGSIVIAARDISDAADIDMCTVAGTFHVMAIGAQ